MNTMSHDTPADRVAGRGRPALDRWRLDLVLLDQPPAPPDYLVHGLVERGSVVLLAGDSGTGKSFIATDLAIAVAQGRPWLGREVKRGRALYVNGENSLRLTVRRLRAMGMHSSDTALRCLVRPPLVLSDRDHRDALRNEVERHRPDLLVLDSALSLAGIDVNDNPLVSEFLGWVRQLAEDYDLVAIVLHHEGKSHVSAGRSTAAAARAALGAMSWRGQADLHLAVELSREPRERTTTPEGDAVDRWRVRLQTPKEREFGDSDGVEDVVVESVRRDRTLLSIEVRSEAAAPRPKRPPTAQRIVAALKCGPLHRAELAEAVGLAEGGGGFKRAIAELIRQDRAIALDDGRIALAEVAR